MFQRLKEKWKISGWQLVLIIATFAIGGSLCGWLSRQILILIEPENKALRVVLYLLLVTLLWPPCVLVLSILTGQFPFFRNYLRRIYHRITGRK